MEGQLCRWLPKTTEWVAGRFRLCCQAPGGTSSLYFAAKVTQAEMFEKRWLHFPLCPLEGSFLLALQRDRGNSFRFLHITPEEGSLASWKIPSQNIGNGSGL